MEKTMINDLTEGPIFGRMIKFMMPMMAANALQVGFNLVDMYFVGKYAGTDALSAVSIAGQLTMLMFSLFLGVAVCGQIYVAQVVGLGRKNELNKVIGNIVFLSVVVGAFLMLIIPLGKPFLRLLNTPEEIMDSTYVYLVILSSINILVALYNGLSGILRGMGDSKRPMYFIIVATLVNVVLDYLFICVFKWGVVGAAWATLIGQTSATIFAIVYLYSKREEFGFDFRLSSMKPDGEILKILLNIGIPVAAKQLAINCSMLFVNAQINNFGVLAVAVTGVSNKLIQLMTIVSQAMNDATASFVGQNMAAGKFDRVRRSVYDSVGFCMIFAIVISVLFLIFPYQIFGIFSSDPDVIAQAPSYLKASCTLVVSFALMSPMLGLINGVGNTMLNMVIAIADGVVGRIALSLIFGYACGMGALGFYLGHCLAGYISVIWGGLYFLSGRWSKRTALMK